MSDIFEQSLIKDPVKETPPWAPFVILGVLALVLTILVATSFYRPGPPPLTLTAAALHIDDGRSSIDVLPSWVDLANVRVVESAREPGFALGRKVGATNMPHYKAGYFKLSNGQTALVHMADGERLVWLPSRGKVMKPADGILVEARDPDAMVAEIKATWH